MQRLSWQDTRLTEADEAFTTGRHQSGTGVGGGTQNFTGRFPAISRIRFQNQSDRWCRRRLADPLQGP